MENKNGRRVSSQKTISGALEKVSAVSQIIMVEVEKSEPIKDPVVLRKASRI